MMTLLRLWVSPMVIVMAASAAAQVPLPAADPQQLEPSLQSYPLSMPQILPAELPAPAVPQDGAQPLLTFKDSDIKFSLQELMDTLRDHRHEGWVLAAYPDPKTNRPLIGAGFSLDVQAVDHPQRDPLNPHPFLEPSSAQLWQAAGLAPDRLQQILDQFDRDLAAWTAKRYRRKAVRQTLTPQLTEEEATQLLRISAIQAVYNAKAYCRGFDQLSAPQQMALSQLVFQMGVNLEEFVDFLGALNDSNGSRELPRLDGYHGNRDGALADSARHSDRQPMGQALHRPGHNRDCHVRPGLRKGARRGTAARGGCSSSSGYPSKEQPFLGHPAFRELQQTFRTRQGRALPGQTQDHLGRDLRCASTSYKFKS